MKLSAVPRMLGQAGCARAQRTNGLPLRIMGEAREEEARRISEKNARKTWKNGPRSWDRRNPCRIISIILSRRYGNGKDWHCGLGIHGHDSLPKRVCAVNC